MSVLEIRLKSEMLAQYGLPDILYPMTAATFETAISGDGDWPFASMLFHVQERSSEGDTNWLELEPAMNRLARRVCQYQRTPTSHSLN